MPGDLTFYFDFISPYAYLAWKAIGPLAARHQMTLRPVPILFAALLNAHGHKGPAEIPPKRIYTFKHTFRMARLAGLPLVPPPSHPFNPLLALRVASLPMADEARFPLIDALYDAAWGGLGGVETPERVAASAARAGLDGASLVAQASTPEAKERVRVQTEKALAAGVFGVPSVAVGDEVFWGVDSLPHVELYLQGRDPLSAEDLERWASLPASASRI